MQFLKREMSPGKAASSGEDFADAGFAKRLPALTEFLCVGQWDDGAPRDLGTLLLFVGDGRWKCMLRDKDGGRVCFTSAATLEALLTQIERGLVGGGLDWRADKQQPGRKGGR
jgi:hypothetical protein